MGSANNKGIKLCKTDYAFVINPDVKFYKNTIDELITCHQSIMIIQF